MARPEYLPLRNLRACRNKTSDAGHSEIRYCCSAEPVARFTDRETAMGHAFLFFGLLAERRVQAAAHVVTANCASSLVGSFSNVFFIGRSLRFSDSTLWPASFSSCCGGSTRHRPRCRLNADSLHQFGTFRTRNDILSCRSSAFRLTFNTE
jgi:hypothetical protein